MKLFRYYSGDSVRRGIVDAAGDAFDVTAFGEDFDEGFFGRDGLERLGRWEGLREKPIALDAVRFASAVARPSKIVCVGLNYRSHATEMKAQIPKEPKIFMKATTALCGVSDPVLVPKGSIALDYEVELAVVVGTTCRYASREEARASIAGYAMMNDYSEREFQKNREGQWVKGKSADSFAPLGPFLVPATEIEPSSLALFLSVNGEIRQEQSTADLIFDVYDIVSSISHYMTLLPGDVISTGTPGGVGMGFSPPRYLCHGDRLHYGIVGLGEAHQLVVDPSRA